MIKQIKWDNHQVLGNLELKFTNDLDQIYNTIILAGENGCGKTNILDTISNFLGIGPFEPFSSIVYCCSNEDYKLFKGDDYNPSQGRIVRENLKGNTQDKLNISKVFDLSRIENDKFDIRHYGVIYSKARSGFNTKKVTSSTTSQLDENKYDIDDKDDFTSIKQLFVDIDGQDSAEWMSISKRRENINIDEFLSNSKSHRFKNAFDNFFDGLIFEGVDNNNSDEKRIIFKKNDNIISIDKLSTGEKQIVFRGAQLLRNANNIDGGVVLIDEPELSMHPKWQNKILDFYRNLFTRNGKQTSQIIIATHSEYVIRSALNAKDKENILIVVLKDDNGIIAAKEIKQPYVLPSITSAETNYIAFGICSIDYHIELYGYLQMKENKISIKDCDDFIVKSKHYNKSIHEKLYIHKKTKYESLPTYIRNSIDHPDSSHVFSENELKTSIELLINLIKQP